MEQGEQRNQGNMGIKWNRGTGEQEEQWKEQEEGLRVRRCMGNRVLFYGPIC